MNERIGSNEKIGMDEKFRFDERIGIDEKFRFDERINMDENNRSNKLNSMSNEGIRLGMKILPIDEASGKRKFCVTLKDTDFFEYEKKMIIESGCPYILPIQFLLEEGALNAYYDFTGYVQINDYIERKTAVGISEFDHRDILCDALDVLMKILGCIKGMGNYLFDPVRFSVIPDAIFVNTQSGAVSIAILPNENRDETFQSNILKTLHSLQGTYQNPEVKKYLGNFADLILVKNSGLDGMIGILGSLQREASYIYYNMKDFRAVDEKTACHENQKLEQNPNEVDFRKEKNSFKSLFNLKESRMIAIQLIFLVGLAIIFFLRLMEIPDFIGLLIICAAVDLSIIKKMNYI